MKRIASGLRQRKRTLRSCVLEASLFPWNTALSHLSAVGWALVMWTATQLPEETQRISTATSGVLARTCQPGDLALIRWWMASLWRRSTVPQPWKARPSELHLALRGLHGAPQVEPPPSGYIRKGGHTNHTHTQAGSSKTQSLGEEELLLTAPKFFCIFFSQTHF